MTTGKARWPGYLGSAGRVGATVALLKLAPRVPDSAVALVLTLAVFLSARIWESGAGIVAAIGSHMEPSCPSPTECEP